MGNNQLKTKDMETQETMTMEVVTKKCKVCGKELPLTEFHKDKLMKDGYKNRCKDCTNTSQRKRKLINNIQVKDAPKVEQSIVKECDDMGLSKVPARLLIHELRRRGYRGKLELVTIQEVVI